MAIPTDRGMVVIEAEDDGTHTIRICAAVVNGKPVKVFAEHNHTPEVRVHTDVALTSAGRRMFSSVLVEVFDDNGVVTVQPITASI